MEHQNINFANQNLQNRSFKGLNLNGANFSRSDIRGCNFSNTSLREANFDGVKAGQTPKILTFVISIACITTIIVFHAVSK
ncbi:MAG: pentapeptide repeat-containing protein [Rivularia sp. (in: cyanobacteria)]